MFTSSIFRVASDTASLPQFECEALGNLENYSLLTVDEIYAM